tara:strand:+ start:3375 stop:4283 length:909 start_codon:yes stop_codon:yes gene_type:complete
MNTAVKISLFIAAAMLMVFLGLALVARNQALDLVYFPLQDRPALNKTPGDFSLSYREVSTRSIDGNLLHAWIIDSQNGAGIILQHGYKSDRTELLEEAAILAKYGYGVLISSIRAHDLNEGELIAFGINEMPDIDAWVTFLQGQESINPDKIGILGNSLGGLLAIQYAAENEDINAVVAHSAFSSMQDTINTSVKYYTDLPAFPFASLIGFWAEQEVDGKIADIDAKKWISRLSPRPVLIMHSLSDVAISSESGELLYAAAGEQKELWQVEGVAHASFDTQMAEEFELRVIGFFDEYVLNTE